MKLGKKIYEEMTIQSWFTEKLYPIILLSDPFFKKIVKFLC